MCIQHLIKIQLWKPDYLTTLFFFVKSQSLFRFKKNPKNPSILLFCDEYFDLTKNIQKSNLGITVKSQKSRKKNRQIVIFLLISRMAKVNLTGQSQSLVPKLLVLMSLTNKSWPVVPIWPWPWSIRRRSRKWHLPVMKRRFCLLLCIPSLNTRCLHPVMDQSSYGTSRIKVVLVMFNFS